MRGGAARRAAALLAALAALGAPAIQAAPAAGAAQSATLAASAAVLAQAAVLAAAQEAAPAGECAAGQTPEECAAEEAAANKKKAAKLRSQADDAVMKKNYKDAVALFTEAMKIESHNEKNVYKRSRVYSKMGNFKAELADLNHALDLKPDLLSALAFRAKAHLALGECRLAAEDYENVLKAKPTHGDAKKLLPKALECSAQIRQVEQFIAQSRFDQAERLASEIIEVTGKAPRIKMLRARTRFAMGNYFEAIADCGDVLKKEPDYIDALLLRGRAYYRVADHEMAQRHFKEALHQDPDNKEVKTEFKRLQKLVKLTNKGTANLKTHSTASWNDALDAFKEALEVDPSHSEHNKVILNHMCTIYTKWKKKAEATDACEQAIRLDPSVLDPYVSLADMLTRMAEETPEFEEALRAWQRAHDVDREDHRVREGLQRAEAGLRQSKQKNYYKILGVPRDAETSQIKRAYRSMAKEYHPDKHSDKSDEEKAVMEGKFQLVAEAYEVLSDAELRAKYDRGEEVFENQGNNNRGHGFPFGRRGGFHFHSRGF